MEVHTAPSPTLSSRPLDDNGDGDGQWLYNVEAKIFSQWNYCNCPWVRSGIESNGSDANKLDNSALSPSNSTTGSRASNYMSSSGATKKDRGTNSVSPPQSSLLFPQSPSSFPSSSNQVTGGRTTGLGQLEKEKGDVNGRGGTSSSPLANLVPHSAVKDDDASEQTSQSLRINQGFDTPMASTTSPHTHPFDHCMKDSFPLCRSSGVPYANELLAMSKERNGRKYEGSGEKMREDNQSPGTALLKSLSLSLASQEKNHHRAHTQNAYLCASPLDLNTPNETPASLEPPTVPFGMRYYARLQEAWSSGGQHISLPELACAVDSSTGQPSSLDKRRQAGMLRSGGPSPGAGIRGPQRRVEYTSQSSDSDSDLDSSFVLYVVESTETEAFYKPIPLESMLDSLYPIWEEEGLVDAARKVHGGGGKPKS